MASKTLVLLFVALFAAQAIAGPVTNKGVSSLITRYRAKFTSWYNNAYDKLVKGVENVKNRIQAQAANLREEIQQRLTVGDDGSAAEECWEEHRAEIDAIEQKFADESQKCMDDNIGPAIEAAEKLQEDLDYFANRTQELLDEGIECGWNLRCQARVSAEMAKLQAQLVVVVAEDYFDLEQKSMVAADAIRRCQSAVIAEEAAALREVYDAVQKCIDDKGAPAEEELQVEGGQEAVPETQVEQQPQGEAVQGNEQAEEQILPEEQATPEEQAQPEEQVTPEEQAQPEEQVTPEEQAQPEEQATPEEQAQPEEQVQVVENTQSGEPQAVETQVETTSSA